MALPIGQTEETKCKNAIRMVRDAMKQLNYTDDGKDIRSFEADTYSYALDLRQVITDRKLTLLVQGSYANKTNIPTESDVDVAVILESTFTSKYRKGVTRSDYGFFEGTDTLESLKDDVEKALKHYFGYQGVERHDKSIKVIGNTNRVDADVVPAYRYRDYSNDYDNSQSNYIGGIEIISDEGVHIINYPEQHIRNGIEKNKYTNYKFKQCVRIIKNMREDMINFGYDIPPEVSSFGLESLLWNVPSVEYIRYSYLRNTIDEILKYLSSNYYKFQVFKEANGIKALFIDDEKRQSYIKFVKELSAFYEYDNWES